MVHPDKKNGQQDAEVQVTDSQNILPQPLLRSGQERYQPLNQSQTEMPGTYHPSSAMNPMMEYSMLKWDQPEVNMDIQPLQVSYNKYNSLFHSETRLETLLTHATKHSDYI